MSEEQDHHPAAAVAAAADGPRVRKLQGAFDKALEKVVEATAFDKLQKRHPDVLPKRDTAKSEVFADLHRQYMEQVVQNTKDEFEAIVAENNLKSALNSLDAAVAEGVQETAPKRLRTAEDARALLSSSIVAMKKAERARLTEELAKIKAENEQLTGMMKSLKPSGKDQKPNLKSKDVMHKAAMEAEKGIGPATLQSVEDWFATVPDC